MNFNLPFNFEKLLLQKLILINNIRKAFQILLTYLLPRSRRSDYRPAGLERSHPRWRLRQPCWPAPRASATRLIEETSMVVLFPAALVRGSLPTLRTRLKHFHDSAGRGTGFSNSALSLTVRSWRPRPGNMRFWALGRWYNHRASALEPPSPFPRSCLLPVGNLSAALWDGMFS